MVPIHQNFTGVDLDFYMDVLSRVCFSVVRMKALLNINGGFHRRQGCGKSSHHPIPHNIQNPARVSFNGGQHNVMVSLDPCASGDIAHLVHKLGESAHVAEKDRHLLPEFLLKQLVQALPLAQNLFHPAGLGFRFLVLLISHDSTPLFRNGIFPTPHHPL